MIHFEVIETKDFDIMGPWNFSKNTVVIGGIQSYWGDLKINNEDFKQEAAQLSVHKDNLIIKTLEDSIPIFINKKKTIANALLSKGDQLQIGHTLLAIKDYSYHSRDFGDELSENLRKIIRSNHPIHAIIKRLEKYLRS